MQYVSVSQKAEKLQLVKDEVTVFCRIRVRTLLYLLLYQLIYRTTLRSMSQLSLLPFDTPAVSSEGKERFG